MCSKSFGPISSDSRSVSALRWWLAALCILVFSLLFVPRISAQSQSFSSPTPLLLKPAIELYQMQTQLISRLIDRSQQIDNLQASLQASAKQYQAASRSAASSQAAALETSSLLAKSKADYASLQEANDKRAADDAANLKRVTTERNVAMIKASHWYLWAIGGFILGVAADEGLHRAGVLR